MSLKKLQVLFESFVKDYIIFSDLISSYIIKIFSTKTGKLIITLGVLYSLSVVVLFVNVILYYILIYALLIFTLYLILKTTYSTKYLSKVFHISSSEIHIMSYFCLYSLYLIITWNGFGITSAGWSGLIYLYSIPLFGFYFVLTTIICIKKFSSNKRYIKINLKLILLLAVLQILLMFFNFRDGGDGATTPAMSFSSLIAIFVYPVYLIILGFFSIVSPLRAFSKTSLNKNSSKLKI
jgi:hypothetical protein